MVNIDRELAKEWLMLEVEIEQDIHDIETRLRQYGQQLRELGDALADPGKMNISAPVVVRSLEPGIQTIREFDLQEMGKIRFGDIAELLGSLQERKQELADIKQKLYVVRNR